MLIVSPCTTVRATISRIVYATLPGVRDGGNRCVFLTLCCLRDDECMFLAITVFGTIADGRRCQFAPISGSFPHFAGRFFDQALGFAVGWNYM